MASTCETRRYVAMIDNLFVKGRLASWRWRALRRHLATCGRCRDHYDKVALLWQAIGPAATPPQVLSSLADDLVRGLGAESGRGARFWGWLAAGTAALVALVLLLRVGGLDVGRGRGGVDGGFVERGEPARGRLRGVRAFCLGTSAGSETVVRAAAATGRNGAPAPELRCHLDEALQLAYSLGDGDAEFLVVVGKDPEGRLLWYTPSRGERPLSIRPGVVDEPLPASVRLAVNHRPGRVVVEALFATQPLSTEDVGKALEAGQLDKLPGIADRQQLLLTLQ